MTLVSNQVVQATCPGCNHSLRIPAAWVGQMMRCKHCSMHFQAKAAGDGQPKKKRRRKRDLLARATRLVMDALPRRRRRKKRKGSMDVPQSKPFAPPPAIPLGQAPANSNLPAAIPVPAGQSGTRLPHAIPVASGQSSTRLPKAIPIGAAGGNGFDLPPVRRRKRGRVKKIIFALIFFLGVGGLGAAGIYIFNNADKSDLGGVHAVGSTGKSAYEVTITTQPTVVTVVPNTQQQRPTNSNPNPPLVGPNPTARETPKPPPPPPTGTALKPPPTQTQRPPTPIGPQVTISAEPRGNFPRRMLAVVPVNYAYANTIGSGLNGPRNITTVIHQLGDLLRINSDQVAVLSDRSGDRKPPIKSMIELNVANYLQSCRPPDRVVLLFVGHGVEVGDKPYLLPLEGDKNNVDTLIPLEWFYQQLAKCPAQQKVFIVDVCRFDPGRGGERGEVEKMGAKFDAMLQAPPPGVQVLTACVAGQHSLEVPPTESGNEGMYDGGIMLAQVPIIKLRGGLKGVIQRPEEPMPVQAVATLLMERTRRFAQRILRSEQTVRLSGAEPATRVAYDPKFPAAPLFDIKLSGDFLGGVASRADIEGVLSDTAGIPPTRRGDVQAALNFDSLPPYALKILAAYKDDGADSPLRDKVKEGIKELQQNNQGLTESFVKNFTNQQQETLFKNNLGQIQMNIGLIQFKLEEILDDLDKMEARRDKESKRWQANFDYVRARLAARVGYLFEYNAMLGQMRKEFPPMDPDIHRGWQLASKARMSDRDAEKFAKRAQKYLDALAKSNAGTPWELVAKRDKVTVLGLDWQPLPK